jgi:geranylgeranyl diphosphate synthase, type II
MMTQMQTGIRDILEADAKRIDQALDRLQPETEHEPVSIHRAMRHSIFAGAGQILDGIEDLGAAIEMLYTYSPTHDDLPALDNDDLRRGEPNRTLLLSCRP